MTAPGDYLEFDESDWFTDQIGDSREFRQAVLDHIRNRPGSKTNYVGKLDYYLITLDGEQYRVITRRVRNDIHLIYVFAWPTEKAPFDDKKMYLKKEYGVQDRGPRRKR